MSTAGLESLAFQICTENQNVGAVMLRARLSAMGVHVSRAKVRAAMIAAVGRRTLYRKIARRVYSVRGPLSLLHLDGNHKLIGQVAVKIALPANQF